MLERFTRFNKSVTLIVLFSVCLGTVLLALPTINRNTGDPNLIAYFNHDDACLMNMAWYYYSGEKSESFLYESDYGLELRYLADIFHLVLSKFMVVTPVTFVLILRWLHLVSWVATLILLWYFIRYHFKGIWQPLVAVLFLSTRFVYVYLSNNLKPDPLALLFVIAGLHFTLKMIDGHRRGNLIAAVACAVAAFLVKFVGIFLLPAVVIAMWLISKYGANKEKFPNLKIALLFPALCGILAGAIVLSSIFLYKRQTTGLTWFQQFGFRESLAQNKMVLYVIIFGILLIIFSAVLWLLGRKIKGRLRRGVEELERVNSYSFIAAAIFVFFFAILGFRWVAHPGDFINIFSRTGREAFGYAGQDAAVRVFSLSAYFQNFITKVKEFNPTVFALFILYLVAEIAMWRKNISTDRPLLLKRVTLVGFLISFFLYMCSGGRVAQQHMLAFFAVAAILGLQGIGMLSSLLGRRVWLRRSTLTVIGLLVAATVVIEGSTMLNLFAYMNRQDTDVVFDIAKWWRDNYPYDTPIIADHPTLAYLPPEYKNVKYLKFQYDRIEQLRVLVRDFKAKLIYLNIWDGKDQEGSYMPPIKEILPDTKVKLVASFDNEGRYFKRWRYARYMVYEVLH